MIWRLIFSKAFGIFALLLSVLNIGVTDHNFHLSDFFQNLTAQWTEFTRWALSWLDNVQFLEEWSFDDEEKDISAAHIIALTPAIFHARAVNIRLSICGIAYILVYMFVFGSSAPDGPDESTLRGLSHVLGMMVFVTFMFWLLSDKYVQRGHIDKRGVFRLILRIWENAFAVFVLVLFLILSGFVSVAQLISE